MDGSEHNFRQIVSAIKWTIAIETVVAVGLAALGIWHVVHAEKADIWGGLALISLALLFYMTRGQVITKLALGKDGIVADLTKMASQAVEKADAAQKDALLAKTVVNQYSGPADQSAPGAEGSWHHPTLKRGKAVPNDPQKNQWGGESERNDRRLNATVEQRDRNWFEIRMWVESAAADKPLQHKVRFHLHDSFRKSVITVEPKSGRAELKRVAYGAFTIGAEVEGEPDTYLELDLAADEFEAPAKFKSR